MTHYVAKCKHGVVMGQCRCMGPKSTRLVDCPPEHASWPPSDNWCHAHDCAAQVCAVAGRGCQPKRNPGLEDYAALEERRLITAFLRKKAEELRPHDKTGAIALMTATLLDAAQWIEQGDYRA